MVPIQYASHAYIDLKALPEDFQAPLERYTLGVLGNEELESLNGRWLLRLSFLDAADDETPEDIVEQLANGDIGFEEYPFDGITWDILGVEPDAYAGYLQAMRFLRTQVPAETIEADNLFLLV